MRRRHVRTVHHEERQPLLLMAAGALAGAAAGLYLGRRYRTLDAFLDDVRERFGDLREAWSADDELEDEDEPDRLRARSDTNDDDSDDDSDDSDDDLEDEIEADEDDEAEALADDDTDDLDDDDTDDLDDDDTDDVDDDADEVDEFDDDLDAVVRTNGSSDASRTGDSAARLLEERVLHALREEPVLGERAIEIAVVGEGVVELTGAVHALEEVSRAAALARRIPGVSMVLNRIEIRAGGHMETASVARDVGNQVAPDAGQSPKP